MLAMESAFSPCFSAQLSSYPMHQGYPLPPNSQSHSQPFSPPCIRQLTTPGDVLSKYVEVAGRGAGGAGAGLGNGTGVPTIGCPNLIPLPTTPPEMEQPGMWLSEPTSWYSRVMSADNGRYYRQAMDISPPLSQQGCMNNLYRTRDTQPQVVSQITSQVTTQVTTLGPCLPTGNTGHSSTTLHAIPENSPTPQAPLPTVTQLPHFSTDNDKSAFKSTSSDLKMNLCYLCGKTYARPSTLKTHMRTHSGEKPYRCETCNKGFSQAANLTAHVRTHTGDKPFRCPVCDRRFSQSSSVTTHMRTHSGERPYKCKVCHKAFSDTSTLTKHIRVHSGEKPYRCTVCHLRFSQSGNLNRHMRTHKQQENGSQHPLYKGTELGPRSVSPYLPDRVRTWSKEGSKIY